MQRLSILLAALLCTAALASQAADLEIVNAETLQVGPCNHQLRFGVRYAVDGADDTPGPLSYRVGVYSSARKALLFSTQVRDHKPGDVRPIFVPADRLICDHKVEIVVDDENKFTEPNRKNNVAYESWEAPSKTGFCMSQLEKCP
jgi:hypothetical protein